MTERYFVTGTDTEVGKTVVSAALLQAAQLLGFTTAGYKPVASGSDITPAGLCNSDVLAMQRNSSIKLTYQQINAYTFAEPTSPHIVSADDQQKIDFSILSYKLRYLETKADWVFVEGAGGWFTPLSKNKSFADWVCIEQLPVIMVVGIKLGCINHALLTALAVQKQAKLQLAGWVANDVLAPGKRHSEYISTLQHLISAPFIGEIPWLSCDEAISANLGQYLDLTMLHKK